MSESTTIFLISSALQAIAIYAAIRADLQELKYRANRTDQRLDKAGL